MQYILAFDPGGTTGWCLAHIPNDAPLRWENVTIIEQNEVPEGHFRMIGDIIGTLTSAPDADYLRAIVVEEFRLYHHGEANAPKKYNQVGSTFPSAQIIGTIRYVVQVIEHAQSISIPIFMQGAHLIHDRKKGVNEKYKTLTPEEIQCLPKSPHVRDAYSHLKVFLRRIERAQQGIPTCKGGDTLHRLANIGKI